MEQTQPPVPKIYQAIADASAEIEAISKSSNNTQQGFAYRGIDAFYNTIHPILARFKVFSTPTILEEHRSIRKSNANKDLHHVSLKIQYRFFTVDGSFVDVIVIGEGLDSGDKASNKAMAIAHKYALMQLFTVPTKDLIDPDSENPEMDDVPKPKSPFNKPKAVPGPLPVPLPVPTDTITHDELKVLSDALQKHKWTKDNVGRICKEVFGQDNIRKLTVAQAWKLRALVDSLKTPDEILQETARLRAIAVPDASDGLPSFEESR